MRARIAALLRTRHFGDGDGGTGVAGGFKSQGLKASVSLISNL